MRLLCKGFGPSRVRLYLPAFCPGHGTDDDPVYALKVHSSRIVKEGLKGNVIMTSPDISSEGIDPPENFDVVTLIDDEPVDDTEYAWEHVDSKALAEERERKAALGIHMG